MPISRSDCAIGAYSGRCSRAWIASTSILVVLDLAEQHQIVAGAVVGVAPDDAVRERLEEGRDLALHRLGVALVELHEQRDDAAGVEVLLDHLEELARVEHRRALHPRIERIGGDGVELLAASSAGNAARRRSGRAPSGCRRRRSCARRNRSTTTFGTSGSISAMVSCSTAGSIETAPAVTPAPQPMTRTFLACGRHQRRQVAEHALQPHVLRLARGLHLAGVVVVEDAVRQLARPRPSVPALADVDDVGLARAASRCSGRRRRTCPGAGARCARQQAGRTPPR